MSSITGLPINIGQLQLPKGAVRKLSDDEVTALEKARENMYRRPVGPADNAPENIYAQVKVNGKVVATLYNSGCYETSNSVGARIQDMMKSSSGSGPQSAQSTADTIAKMLGGTVDKAQTAQTQAQWEARPPRQFYIDYAAMEADWGRSRSSSTEFTAQLLAQTTT